MTEKEMEDLLWNHPEKLLGEQLTQFERQSGSAVGRADLIFVDRIGRFLVVEVKRGKLQRGAVEQLHDYYGVMKRRFPDKAVELMVVANQIPAERRLACDKLDIETCEVSEKKFRDVASEIDYVFLSEIGSRSGLDQTENRAKTDESKRLTTQPLGSSGPQNPQQLRWERASLGEDCFDLRLVDPKMLDTAYCEQLLQAVQTAYGSNPKHFSTVAGKEFQRWLDNLDTPLREQAYARLSNWFLTGKGDCKESLLAQAALKLWNALFCAQPSQRLTLPEKNHKILREEFDLWWSKQLDCQNG